MQISELHMMCSTKYVTRSDKVVADGWAGAIDPVPHPPSTLAHDCRAKFPSNCAFSQFSTRSSQIDGLTNRVTESMLKFESGLPRGRNVTISITDDNPKIWWRSNKVYPWPHPPPHLACGCGYSYFVEISLLLTLISPQLQLKALIPALRLQSQLRGSNPSLEAPIPASRLKSQLQGSNPSLKAQIQALWQKSQPHCAKFPLCSTGHRPLRGRCPRRKRRRRNLPYVWKVIGLRSRCPKGEKGKERREKK